MLYQPPDDMTRKQKSRHCEPRLVAPKPKGRRRIAWRGNVSRRSFLAKTDPAPALNTCSWLLVWEMDPPTLCELRRDAVAAPLKKGLAMTTESWFIFRGYVHMAFGIRREPFQGTFQPCLSTRMTGWSAFVPTFGLETKRHPFPLLRG